MNCKKSIIFLAALCSSAVFAADTVRLDSEFNNFAVTASTSATISLNVDKPTAQPTTDTTAAKIYVPVQKDDTDSKDYFLDSVNGVPTIVDASSSSTHTINFPLQLSVSATDKYLYSAVRDTFDSNSYKVIAAYSVAPINNVTNANYTFRVQPAAICAIMVTDCQNLVPTSGFEVDKTFKLYFFLSTSSTYTFGSTIDPAAVELNNGIYFDVGMSNRVSTASELTISITNVRKGDGRLILDYTASQGILNAKGIRIFNHNGATPAGNLPIGDAAYDNPGAALLGEEHPYIQSGEVTVRDLNNSASYNLSLLFVDKYKFATPLSVFKSGTPTQIEELLKEKGCFLLTAGFGEDHYIIDYFRSFRDQVLLPNYLGRKFVGAYYSLAPKYAIIIYENEVIRSIIRGAAYILYFAFNHIYAVLISAIFIPLILIFSATLRKIIVRNS